MSKWDIKTHETNAENFMRDCTGRGFIFCIDDLDVLSIGWDAKKEEPTDDDMSKLDLYQDVIKYIIRRTPSLHLTLFSMDGKRV